MALIMEDIELNTGINFLKDHIKINYSDLKISEGLIQNGNVVIFLPTATNLLI